MKKLWRDQHETICFSNIVNEIWLLSHCVVHIRWQLKGWCHLAKYRYCTRRIVKSSSKSTINIIFLGLELVIEIFEKHNSKSVIFQNGEKTKICLNVRDPIRLIIVGCKWLILSYLHKCESNHNIVISFKQYGILNQFLRHNTSAAMFFIILVLT